jgi:hypothetical protein
MSSISEQLIKDAINAETNKMIASSKLRETQTDQRITQIETALTTLTSTIVPQIFDKLYGHDSPFVTVTMLDEKLERLSRQIEQMSRATSPPSSVTNSPPPKKARASGPTASAMDIVRAPPEPRLYKVPLTTSPTMTAPIPASQSSTKSRTPFKLNSNNLRHNNPWGPEISETKLTNTFRICFQNINSLRLGNNGLDILHYFCHMRTIDADNLGATNA